MVSLNLRNITQDICKSAESWSQSPHFQPNFSLEVKITDLSSFIPSFLTTSSRPARFLELKCLLAIIKMTSHFNSENSPTFSKYRVNKYANSCCSQMLLDQRKFPEIEIRDDLPICQTPQTQVKNFNVYIFVYF